MRGRYTLTSLTRISDLEEAPFTVERVELPEWSTGDYVAVEVIRATSKQRLEVPSGRLVEVMEGDLAIGALGVRHATLEATGSWREVGEDGRLSFLTGAGLLGKCTSLSYDHPPLNRAVYRGHVHRAGRPARMADYVSEVTPAPLEAPVVLVIGTSMSAGKTTAARTMIRLLKAEGMRLAGAKLAGAGAYRDALSMGDAGADAFFDFTDGGLPSTVVSEERYRRALQTLLSRIAHEQPDVAVVELGASPLEPYNGETAANALREQVAFTVLCSSDPYAVIGLMDAYDLRPDLVTGPATNTLAGRQLTEELTGIPAVDIRDPDRRPGVRDLLLAAVEPWR